MARIASKFAEFNPFHKSDTESDDDVGEEIDSGTIAGGGHGDNQAEAHKGQLRVSLAMRAFMAREGILSPKDAGENTSAALDTLLRKPHIKVPALVLDRSHPLPEYFISSSHNTYLMAHQLFGTSAATAYETALLTGSRCVEIDAWDSDDHPDEPKVTHGFTLVSNIPFRAVCETIRDVIDRESRDSRKLAAPVLISLENHCGPHGQRRMVEIMREVLGHRLIDSDIQLDDENSAAHVPLSALGTKVAVIVEYHLPNEPETASSSSSSSSSSDSENEDEKKGRDEYRKKKKSNPPAGIVPELAALGVYAQSVKPRNKSWYDPGELSDGPHHHLINVSETGLASHIAEGRQLIARHNARNLMRVFPKGTRISSRNLNPVPFWGIGAQICALNWQTFGGSMQLNDALFSGSAGFVLKPEALRAGGDGKLTKHGCKKRLSLRIAGATDVPFPIKNKRNSKGDDTTEGSIKPYLTCTLHHPDDIKRKLPKRKTKPFKSGDGEDEGKGNQTNPIWDETLQWEYDDNELVFLRMLIKSDDGWSKNPKMVVAAVRVMYLLPGWSFVRMLDLRGHESMCSMLVKFEIEDC